MYYIPYTIHTKYKYYIYMLYTTTHPEKAVTAGLVSLLQRLAQRRQLLHKLIEAPSVHERSL